MKQDSIHCKLLNGNNQLCLKCDVMDDHDYLRYYIYSKLKYLCLQCFDAVGWVAGRASGLKKLSGGVLAWLSV